MTDTNTKLYAFIGLEKEDYSTQEQQCSIVPFLSFLSLHFNVIIVTVHNASARSAPPWLKQYCVQLVSRQYALSMLLKQTAAAFWMDSCKEMVLRAAQHCPYAIWLYDHHKHNAKINLPLNVLPYAKHNWKPIEHWIQYRLLSNHQRTNANAIYKEQDLTCPIFAQASRNLFFRDQALLQDEQFYIMPTLSLNNRSHISSGSKCRKFVSPQPVVQFSRRSLCGMHNLFLWHKQLKAFIRQCEFSSLEALLGMFKWNLIRKTEFTSQDIVDLERLSLFTSVELNPFFYHQTRQVFQGSTIAFGFSEIQQRCSQFVEEPIQAPSTSTAKTSLEQWMIAYYPELYRELHIPLKNGEMFCYENEQILHLFQREYTRQCHLLYNDMLITASMLCFTSLSAAE